MKSFVTLLLLLIASVFSAEAQLVSQAEFNDAATKNGYKAPPEEIYRLFIEVATIYSKEENAMFLAQLLHESIGFTHSEELPGTRNSSAKCENDHAGLPGKVYYGRGYIQLTCPANYKAASRALGLEDKLLREPELVASNKRYAMLVSGWYWTTRVRPQLGTSNEFGRTTKAINGGECKYSHIPKYRKAAENRWKIYLKVAESFNIYIDNRAKENGCYN